MALKQKLTPGLIGGLDKTPAGTDGQLVKTVFATPVGEIGKALTENTTPTGAALVGAPEGTIGLVNQGMQGEVNYKQIRAQNVTPDGHQVPVITGVDGNIIRTMFADIEKTKAMEFYLYKPLLQYVIPTKSGLAGVMIGGASGGNGVTRDGWLPPRKAPHGFTPIRREQPTT